MSKMALAVERSWTRDCSAPGLPNVCSFFRGGEVVSYYGIDAFTLTQAVYGYYLTHHSAKDYIDCGFLVGSHFRSLICVVKGYLLNVVLTLCLQYFKRSSWTLRLPTLLFYILQCTVCTW